MASGIGFYVGGGLLVLVGLLMMLWRVTLGLLTGTGSFWLGLLIMVIGIGIIAAGAGRRKTRQEPMRT